MEFVALPFVILVYVALSLFLPTLRTWRHTGQMPVAFARSRDPVQRFMGAAIGLFLLAVTIWALLVAFIEPVSLGLWQRPLGFAWAGYGLMAIGTTIEVVAQAQMGASWRVGVDAERTALVTRGLFCVVRNPIFSGLILSLLGVVAITPSPWTVMGFVMATALIALQARLEERHLSALHGDAYLSYARSVGRFVPGIGRLDAGIPLGSYG